MRFLALLLVTACATAPQPVLVPTPQGRLYVFDSRTGSGVPIVFIHGNGANLTQWAAQLQHFAKSRRVVAIDLRGMGNSDVPADGIYTLDAMVEDIHSVVNTLNVDRFVAVGHSYGGSVVSAYAAAHPERVAGVVYADAAGTVAATDEQWDRYLSALRMDKVKVVRGAFEPILENASPEVKGAVYSSVDRTSTEAFTEAMEDLRHFDVKRAIAAYKGPVLVIAAIDTPSSLHVQFPDLPMRRMDGVSHWLMMDKPAEFNAILEEFVRGLDAR
jgi:pimeloyl-ACP methyl ester carboxylesterase